MSGYVLLDRDGTIIEHRPYLSEPDQVELLPGVVEGLQAMISLKLRLIVVTNQSGIGRGYFSSGKVDIVHERMLQLLDEHGIHIDAIYFCPHTPTDKCHCRKPSPGLVEKAADQFGFLSNECFIIGDNICDIELSRGVGATSFLVRTGYGRKVEQDQLASPDYVVDSVSDIAPIIDELNKSNAQYS